MACDENGNALMRSCGNRCAKAALEQPLRKCQAAGDAGEIAVTELAGNPAGNRAGIDHARMWISNDWIDRGHARLHIAADDHVALAGLGCARQHGHQDPYAAIQLHARHPLKGGHSTSAPPPWQSMVWAKRNLFFYNNHLMEKPKQQKRVLLSR